MKQELPICNNYTISDIRQQHNTFSFKSYTHIYKGLSLSKEQLGRSVTNFGLLTFLC